MSDNVRVKLNNVRLSFPALFKKAVFEGNEGKYEGTFLIHKDEQTDLIKTVEASMDKFLVSKFGSEAKIPKSLKRTCFADGDTKDYDGYENHMAFKGTSNSRFPVLNRDKTPLASEDDVIYAGCYVNAILEFWYSDHPKGGKQLLANLLGVQFAKAGETFSAASVASVDDFEMIDDDEF
tara:strand:+ start:2020 stop:2556 length:537 start_codon:yes stop_codon:yes gene_type:complete